MGPAVVIVGDAHAAWTGKLWPASVEVLASEPPSGGLVPEVPQRTRSSAPAHAVPATTTPIRTHKRYHGAAESTHYELTMGSLRGTWDGGASMFSTTISNRP